jgi:hypothetical protein
MAVQCWLAPLVDLKRSSRHSVSNFEAYSASGTFKNIQNFEAAIGLALFYNGAPGRLDRLP